MRDAQAAELTVAVPDGPVGETLEQGSSARPTAPSSCPQPGQPASRAAWPARRSRAARVRYRYRAVSLRAAPGWLISPRV